MRKYLVYLNWPEACFQAQPTDLDFLRTLVPADARVVAVRDDEEFLRELPDATHALVWNFDRAWFARAPHLELLATPAAGRELMPTEGPSGVKIHFGGFHGAYMGETAVAFALAWARGILPTSRLKEPSLARWPRTWVSSRAYEVAGTHAVIIGYGRVGRAVGAKFEALGATVFGYSRHLGLSEAALKSEMNRADWLILALPGDTGTTNWLNRERLADLPRRAVVINVGRGNSIDESSLFAALAEGRLAAACLDVRATEPPPSLGGRLPETPPLDNLFLLPHASAFSPHYMRSFFQELQHDGCL